MTEILLKAILLVCILILLSIRQKGKPVEPEKKEEFIWPDKRWKIPKTSRWN